MNIKNKIVAFGGLLLFLSCATNPFTGKQTMAFVANDQIFPASFQQYNQVLSESKVVKGTSEAEMIKRVGERIATASERWLNALGYQGYLKDYRWEYNLIQSDVVNAWCMPGGKIAFYTGILPIAENETAIAAIMGHEVAHALVNHGQQRMSAGMLQQAGAIGLNVFLQDNENLELFNQAYGIGSTVGGMLPFSRAHEEEADKIGLYIMAIAGYNPDEASRLWERMGASGGQSPPEILSTHPSTDSRIANLKALAPKAKAEAQKFGVTSYRPITKF
ncbi:M48 family metallopeptidase [Mangrovimonas sp. AS39]|uniref:M48 family metallopeptidase n=1 Tax=Mangrovimonas TaxID=1211036 RepID=UPI0014214B3A|nr:MULTISPECIES: M48 family metallopeptidase [Mangrovimonas]MCF1192811.1 M48 family metallopeptidase [Mangrovimonas futianensis]MCF1196587.1 M48 family metallopeptidase [Mangrovimonas futianensis]NIK93373.1 M48 family metallopeptidase [Mangrovimonas sp. CR14]